MVFQVLQRKKNSVCSPYQREDKNQERHCSSLWPGRSWSCSHTICELHILHILAGLLGQKTVFPYFPYVMSHWQRSLKRGFLNKKKSWGESIRDENIFLVSRLLNRKYYSLRQLTNKQSHRHNKQLLRTVLELSLNVYCHSFKKYNNPAVLLWKTGIGT